MMSGHWLCDWVDLHTCGNILSPTSFGRVSLVAVVGQGNTTSYVEWATGPDSSTDCHYHY